MITKTKKKIPKRRSGFYYLDVSPTPLASITHIIDQLVNKQGLVYGGIKKAAEIALENPELSTKDVQEKVFAEWKKSMNKGADVHSMINAGGTNDLPEMKAYADYVKENPHEIIARECLVYCKCLGDGYAGRVDVIEKLSTGIVSVSDYKTGEIYDSVYLQASAYKHALLENGYSLDEGKTWVKIERVDIMRAINLRKDGSYVIHRITDVFDAWIDGYNFWNKFLRK